MLVLETHDVFRVGPFPRGILAELHQTNLLCQTASVRIEVTLAPDERFDQHRVNAIAFGGETNRGVLTAFEVTLPGAICDGSASEQQNQNPGKTAPFHAILLSQSELRVERN